MQENATALQDTDGIPPGLDTVLTGQRGKVLFTGKFYAAGYREMSFSRPVRIVFASKDIYVAYDLEGHNLYVVDRKQNLSLGCQMNAEFIQQVIP